MMVLFSLVMLNFNIMIANNLIRREQNMHLFVEVFKKKYHTPLVVKETIVRSCVFLIHY